MDLGKKGTPYVRRGLHVTFDVIWEGEYDEAGKLGIDI